MSNEQTILAIAMNLTRMGNWAADGSRAREKHIATFLEQPKIFLTSLETETSDHSFQKTLQRFLQDFEKLEDEAKHVPNDEKWWAERMMTWGNILTHRAKLVK